MKTSTSSQEVPSGGSTCGVRGIAVGVVALRQSVAADGARWYLFRFDFREVERAPIVCAAITVRA
jgi:hypothetical protein